MNCPVAFAAGVLAALVVIAAGAGRHCGVGARGYPCSGADQNPMFVGSEPLSSAMQISRPQAESRYNIAPATSKPPGSAVAGEASPGRVVVEAIRPPRAPRFTTVACPLNAERSPCHRRASQPRHRMHPGDGLKVTE